jgi:hypothetical protein
MCLNSHVRTKMARTTFSGPVVSLAGFIGPAAYTELTAASTLTAEQSGSVFFLNAATEFATTLPAPVAGLTYTFIVKAAPSGANYTIVTAASANIIKGQAYPASGDAGDTGTSDDTISFVSAAAVAGDMVTVISDGTSWFAKGFCAVATGITFTTAS